MSDAFKKWYERNKDEYNRKRRKRYAEDLDYRHKVIDASRRSRKSKRPAPKMMTIEGHSVIVFTISEVADYCGVSPSLIRDHERMGAIPKVVGQGKHRRYSANQRELLMVYFTCLKSGVEHEDAAQALAENWGVVE